MIERPFWKQRIEEAWQEAPIVWLCGVRRSGKTTLAKSLGEDRILYLNCDLPIVEEILKDPQLFFHSCNKEIIVFDEIHQLRDPARILKIGADEHSRLKILATGSSTLAASKKFQDTLTGRKRTIHLTPVMWNEINNFRASLQKRLYHGGLPASLLASDKNPALFREWIDSFFARDIQRLFAFRDMNRFNALFEYLIMQSGGQLETTKIASAMGISRPTVESHLSALQITHALTLVRPFHGGRRNEVVKQPKGYAFDTGFVSFVRGWDPLRPEDLGILFEHLVLEHLQSCFPNASIHYWLDKSGREIDFVLPQSRDRIDAVECKWDPETFDPNALRIFRSAYPNGLNFLITPSASIAYDKSFGDLSVRICTMNELRDR
jgi:uncharacterized protein